MKNNKGITLIALVITIIVMLILVGVTISMAVNGGLFNYAGQAVRDTNTKLQEEQLLTNTDIIDYYVNRKPAVTALKAYSTDLLNDDGVLDENTKYESGKYTAVIPEGFKVSDVAEEQTIAGGLVIEDAEENQFVWIPVKTGEFKRERWYSNNMTGEEYLEQINLNSYTDYQLFIEMLEYDNNGDVFPIVTYLWDYSIIEYPNQEYTEDDVWELAHLMGYFTGEPGSKRKGRVYRGYNFRFSWIILF